MKTLLRNPLFYLTVVLTIFVSWAGIGFVTAQQWHAPTQPFPNQSEIGEPLNSGSREQTKSGVLKLGDVLEFTKVGSGTVLKLGNNHIISATGPLSITIANNPVRFNTGGIVLPRVSGIASLKAQEGMIVFDSLERKIKLFDGTSWGLIAGNASGEWIPATGGGIKYVGHVGIEGGLNVRVEGRVNVQKVLPSGSMVDGAGFQKFSGLTHQIRLFSYRIENGKTYYSDYADSPIIKKPRLYPLQSPEFGSYYVEWSWSFGQEAVFSGLDGFLVFQPSTSRFFDISIDKCTLSGTGTFQRYQCILKETPSLWSSAQIGAQPTAGDSIDTNQLTVDSLGVTITGGLNVDKFLKLPILDQLPTCSSDLAGNVALWTMPKNSKWQVPCVCMLRDKQWRWAEFKDWKPCE